MSAAFQDYPKFQSHWATFKNCSIEFIFGQICFLHNGTQLEGETCKFQKLQNKDNPSTDVTFHILCSTQINTDAFHDDV